MSENLEDNEPRIIPPAVGNTQNEHVEPLIGTEHAPRVARSVSSDPEESALLLQVPPLPCVRHLAVAPPGLAA